MATYIDFYLSSRFLIAAYDYRPRVSAETAQQLAVAATLFTLFTLVCSSVLLALRGQTLGAWIAGIRLVTMDGIRPEPLHSITLRWIGPLVVSFLAMTVPFGLLLLLTINYGPVFGDGRRSTLDHLTQMKMVSSRRFGPLPLSKVRAQPFQPTSGDA